MFHIRDHIARNWLFCVIHYRSGYIMKLKKLLSTLFILSNSIPCRKAMICKSKPCYFCCYFCVRYSNVNISLLSKPMDFRCVGFQTNGPYIALVCKPTDISCVGLETNAVYALTVSYILICISGYIFLKSLRNMKK